jgi:hypothetical protein
MVVLQTTSKIRLFGSLLFLVLFALLIIIADTIYLEPPFVEEKSSVEVGKGNITLRVDFVRHNNNTARFENELITTKEVVYLSNSVLRNDNFVRVYANTTAKGCIRSTMSYRYRLSLREHTRELSLACFERTD